MRDYDDDEMREGESYKYWMVLRTKKSGTDVSSAGRGLQSSPREETHVSVKRLTTHCNY